MQPDRPSPLLSVVLFFGTFLAGGFAGLALASWLAPESGFAYGVSGMLLPFAFLVGTVAWTGVVALRAPIIWIRRIRGSPGGGPGGASAAVGRPVIAEEDVRRGARVFVVAATVVNLLGGLVVGLVPGGGGVLSTAGIYGLVGYAYGHLLWQLVRRGHLQLEG